MHKLKRGVPVETQVHAIFINFLGQLQQKTKIFVVLGGGQMIIKCKKMACTWGVTQSSPLWSLCISYTIILAGLLSIQPSEELASCTLEKNKTYATFWTERTCLKSFKMAFFGYRPTFCKEK